MEAFIKDELCIIRTADFSLDDPCNLAFLERPVHISLDLYAFIAITASSPTLEELLEMVQKGNDTRQRELDTGELLPRTLYFRLSGFVNPEYELVALYPEHFLPGHCVLTVYGPGGTHKHYVPATDRRLCESQDPSSQPSPHSITLVRNKSSIHFW